MAEDKPKLCTCRWRLIKGQPAKRIGTPYCPIHTNR